MQLNQTLQQLRQLKLSGMAEALVRQLEQAGTYDELAFTELLQLLIDEETLTRQHRKQERLINQARFKLQATLQDVDYRHPHNLSRKVIAQLAQTTWLDNAQNLLITGPCGSGKSYLACALGHNVCL
ncbi:MAG: ATP-binding protein, partial [Candidatus Thiodiazotropha sp.]